MRGEEKGNWYDSIANRVAIVIDHSIATIGPLYNLKISRAKDLPPLFLDRILFDSPKSASAAESSCQ